ncbi:hypothetical protein IG197_32435 (plasmid) [Aminobacter sp. SR38]|jgi:hypothetical protein|uniref:hypothetical protein n=1 Tax=Hyphomicrobiales TaxID=356 RepID=UPI0017862D8A|nr:MULTISPECIES: hypothetical protein [Hyphomicrobiales]MCZ7497445.1 hypothetical protein [Rhizobium rhizogenes]MCZ7501938.1 hypothetical protein [Rhizobium rhizogenes]QOF75278.1 hypothetical protein IG197_32435 [Aminobacter sp. SR38]
MGDESEELSKTLAWTCGMIEDCQRIALAYCEARDLVASIPKDNGDARPRILACFARSDAYRAEDDIACVGWILTAIQERVNERDLRDWRQLRKVINKAIELLPLREATMH